MQLRTFTVIAAAALVIGVPAAGAHIPEAAGQGSGTVNSRFDTVHFGLVERVQHHKAAKPVHHTAKKATTARRRAATPATRLVVPPMITVPSTGPMTADQSSCYPYMADCNDPAYCAVAGLNCSSAGGDEATASGETDSGTQTDPRQTQSGSNDGFESGQPG